MQISICTKEDYDQILDNFAEFWGSMENERVNRIRILHHPILFYELGHTAFVIKDNGKVAAYLLGLFSQKEPLAYTQFISTHQDYQRRGLATRLYNHFIDIAKQKGCQYIKAITAPVNKTSIKFHQSIGMQLLGEPNAEGIPVIANYDGPGVDRVVFLKSI